MSRTIKILCLDCCGQRICQMLVKRHAIKIPVRLPRLLGNGPDGPAPPIGAHSQLQSSKGRSRGPISQNAQSAVTAAGVPGWSITFTVVVLQRRNAGARIRNMNMVHSPCPIVRVTPKKVWAVSNRGPLFIPDLASPLPSTVLCSRTHNSHPCINGTLHR